MENSLIQSALEDIIARYQTAGYFPSASVRIFDKDNTLASACAGDAREDSLFDLASVTKTATATGILNLIKEKLLDLDAPVSEQFQEIRNDTWLSKRLRGITVRKLMTHTSGLPAWYPFYVWQNDDFWTVFKAAVHSQLPTEGVVYSDLNFILLGKLLELKRKMPLKDCLTRFITEPLGIDDEMMYQPPAAGKHIIPSCNDNSIEEQMCADRGMVYDAWRPRNVPVIGTVNDGNCHYYFGDVSGHAGVFATARALQKFCQAYMNSESAIFREAQKEQPDSPGRGLGFETTTMYPHGCGHNGFTGTSIYFSTEYNIGVVALANRLFFPTPSGKNMGEFRRALHEMAFSLSCIQNC